MSGPRSDVPLRHRFEYAAFRIGVAFLRRLPERWALGLGGALGVIAGGPLRIRRRVSEENVARAFPESGPRWRAGVVRASYRNLGREAVASFLFSGETAERLRERTLDAGGLEALVARVRGGQGAVLVTGHFGSWEMAGAAVAARGVALDAVAVRQANRLFDEALVRNRARLGISVIRRGDATREVLRSLRAGRVPALVADQDARRAGVFVDFLGHPASTARGPALFALRADVPLFLGICLPAPDDPGRYLCHVQEIEVERTGVPHEDVRRLTAAHAAALAAWVRRHPEHYFWQHRRWRSAPPAVEGNGQRPEPRGMPEV